MLVLSPLSAWYLPRLGLRLVVLSGMILLSAGLLCLRLVHLDSSYWGIAWPLLVVSTGIGIFTAPTTSAIMTSTPDDKQGVASAVNDTTREIGAALGIALTGSLLASGYSQNILATLGAFPPMLRDAAHGSLAGATAAAARMGPAAAPLLDAAKLAFLHAMQSTLLVLALITAAAGVVIAFWTPGRDRSPLGRHRK